MSFFPISHRVYMFISPMSGSVLVALLALMAVAGDNGARLALLTPAIGILLLKKSLPAITAGIVACSIFVFYEVMPFVVLSKGKQNVSS